MNTKQSFIGAFISLALILGTLLIIRGGEDRTNVAVDADCSGSVAVRVELAKGFSNAPIEDASSNAYGIDAREYPEEMVTTDDEAGSAMGEVSAQALLRYREEGGGTWRTVPLENTDNDERTLQATFTSEPGREYAYEVFANAEDATEEIVASGTFGALSCPTGGDIGLEDDMEQSDASMAPGSRTVLMLHLFDSYYPESQFVIKAVSEPEPEHDCNRPHYHSKTGREVYGIGELDGQIAVGILGDKDQTGCGFGLYDDIERVNRVMTAEEIERLHEYLPNF